MSDTVFAIVWVLIAFGLLGFGVILIRHDYVMSGGYRAWKARREHRKAGYPQTTVEDF